MSKRIFSEEQINELLQNQNVAGCSDKSISYHKDFKIMAVKKYQEGLPPNEIFRQAGFDTKMIGRDTPHECLRRWLKKEGTGLETDGRGQSKSGGRPKTNWSNEKEKIKYLETENAYLKEENRFLAKLRKKSLN
jgi:transposase-like protein